MSLSALHTDTHSEHCHNCARQGKKYFSVYVESFHGHRSKAVLKRLAKIGNYLLYCKDILTKCK